MASVKVLTDQLKCSVCKEVLCLPRSLPCLHTFCEKCLQCYICTVEIQVSESKKCFKCPQCQLQIFPCNQQESKETWINEFPTCKIIESVLEEKIKRDQSSCNKSHEMVCTLCSGKNTPSTAFGFCIVCTQYLCKQCFEFHRKFKQTRQHKVLIDDELQLRNQFQEMPVPGICHIHPSCELEFKCFDHDKLVCSECAIFSHRNCQNIKHVDEHFSDNRFNNEEVTKTSRQLKECVHKALEAKIHYAKELDSLTHSIEKHGNDFLDSLRSLTSFLDKEILKTFKEQSELQNSVFSQYIAEGINMFEKVTKTSDLAEVVIKHGSDIQLIFLCNTLSELELSVGNLTVQKEKSDDKLITVSENKVELVKKMLKETIHVKLESFERIVSANSTLNSADYSGKEENCTAQSLQSQANIDTGIA